MPPLVPPVLTPQRRRARRQLLVLGLLAYLLTRIPLLLRHPDWGAFDGARCFFLSNAVVSEQLQAIFPEWPVPLWIVDPGRYDQTIARGVPTIGWLVLQAARLAGPTLLTLKMLGLLLHALTIGVFAWALERAWPAPEDRGRVSCVLIAVAIGTPALVWSTLLPQGQLTEAPLFQALHLLPLLAALEGRLTVWGAVMAGALAGAATAWAAPNLVLGMVVIAAVLVFGGSWRERLLRVLAFASVAFLTWGVVRGDVSPSALHGTAVASDLGLRVAPFSLGLAQLNPSRTLLGSLGSHVDDADHIDLIAQLWLMGAALLAAFIALLRLLPGSLRARAPLGSRLLAANALVVLALAGWGHLDGDWGGPVPLGTHSIPDWSLMLVAPALLALVGLAAGWTTRLSALRWPSRVASGILLTALVVGAGLAGARNLEDRGMPPQERCDAERLGVLIRPPLLGDAAKDPSLGVPRCRLARPQSGQLCEHLAFLESDVGIADCFGLPEGQRESCAWAVGAREHGPTWCRDPLDSSVCGGAGGLSAACRRGAARPIGAAAEACLPRLAELCATSFAGAQEARCRELSARFTLGVADFPDAPPSYKALAPACRSWPDAWRGGCQEVAASATLPGPGPAGPTPPGTSCTDHLAEELRTTFPAGGRDSYEQCRWLQMPAPGTSIGTPSSRDESDADEVLVVPAWSWCAIGVGRDLGHFACRWEDGG